MSDCIGCLLPPVGMGAGASTSNGLNSAPIHDSVWSISGVTSPISSVSSSEEESNEEPDLVSFQVLMVTSSKSSNPLLDEK